jgi:hypothetical protein
MLKLSKKVLLDKFNIFRKEFRPRSDVDESKGFGQEGRVNVKYFVKLDEIYGG